MACWYAHHYGRGIAHAQQQAAAAAAVATGSAQADEKEPPSSRTPPRTTAPVARWWQDPAQVCLPVPASSCASRSDSSVRVRFL
jgi:hypothetical protein